MLAAVAQGPPPEPARAQWRFVGDDQMAIRAPQSLVMDTLLDAHGWRHWWPRVRWYPKVSPPPVRDGGTAARRTASLLSPPNGAIEFGDGWLSLWRATLTPDEYRPGIGWRWHVGGDVDALSEIWLEVSAGVAIVHHLLWEGEFAQRHAMGRWRRTVRAGLWALKDHCQSYSRTSMGLLP